ncbi:hypothetical protein NQ317_012357 [Molorchus minor]|uniref:WW domain-containing protein n=1 Tax=Molorchus minor TaxID=1323400 RepID=A0ABQ9J0Z4_9CUCU|nr:hypothetical protein NQ317_012357 [Molorchus minor]
MPIPPALAAKLSKRGLIARLSTCPNKSNIYHECNYWCETHWKGVPVPDPRYVRNMQKLMVKYPLPNNWTEIFDKGVGRNYYWNMENDLVSWLPRNIPSPLNVRVLLSYAKIVSR